MIERYVFICAPDTVNQRYYRAHLYLCFWYNLCCISLHFLFFPFLSICGWQIYHLFVSHSPHSASFCTKAHQRTPTLFPSAIIFTRPVKHIKNPAGSFETINPCLQFLCLLNHPHPHWLYCLSLRPGKNIQFHHLERLKSYFTSGNHVR